MADCTRLFSVAAFAARLIVWWNVGSTKTHAYEILPQAILAQATRALSLPPTPERTFHIAEFTRKFRRTNFSPLKTVFYIAKTARYLIEK